MDVSDGPWRTMCFCIPTPMAAVAVGVTRAPLPHRISFFALAMVLQSQPTAGAKKHWMPALAGRIPKVKSTGDVMPYQHELLVRKSLECILQRFAEDPQSCVNVATSLQAGMIQSVSPKKDQADDDSQLWDSSFKYFRKMPNHYMSQVLVELSPDKHKMTKAVINLIDKNNKDAVRNLFFMVMGLSPADAWPTAPHDRGVCHAMLQKRGAQVGQRMSTFLQSNALNYTTGDIDWGKCAPYSVFFLGGERQRHPCETQLGGHGGDQGFRDQLIAARFAKGKLIVLLHDIFDKGGGPNKTMIDEKAGARHMHSIAAELSADLVAADIARAKLQANTLKVDSDFLSISTKEKRDAGLKRARDKAAEKKIESKLAKVLVLSPGAVGTPKVPSP